MFKFGNARRVDRGARLLDERRSGWADRIDCKQLDLMNGSYCILGQLYGNYGSGSFHLGLFLGDAVNCGFYVPVEGLLPYEWRSQTLEDAWVREIQARLSTAVAA